jgi:hypothetical protein
MPGALGPVSASAHGSPRGWLDRIVVVLVLELELVELTDERGVGGEQFAHAHEGAHDLNVDGDGGLTDQELLIAPEYREFLQIIENTVSKIPPGP